ncbi:uncharacterized protein [Temnothorax longispinosus]|uniref:uncharacterized protein n=1 Tax=Temnothorax longispinosus TaxID=300112 RepID=UPI003A995737
MIFLEDCDHHRTLLENEKGHNLEKKEHFFGRGDSKIIGNFSKAQPNKRNSAWQIRWASNAQISTRVTRCTCRKRRNKHFRTSKKGTALLRCNEGTFRVRKIYGDGNCTFRAISYILWRNEEEHQSLRTTVVQHIKDNWREYEPFVMAEWNISDSQEYYDYMSLVGTFASELECTVATKLHRMNLSIYRELPGRYELKLVFHNRVNVGYETARLLFTGCSENGHYDVLLPDSMTSFFMGE